MPTLSMSAPGSKADRTLTLLDVMLVRPQKPESAVNWIKTTPGKGWFPYFRFYAPKQAYFDKTWQLNDLEEVR
jgi:hypothetical protein